MLTTILMFLTEFPLWILSIAVILGILTDHYHNHNWCIFFTLMVLGGCYFIFKFPIETLVIGVISYLIIGFIWSFYRYKRHIADSIVNINKMKPGMNRNSVIDRLAPEHMTNELVAWVINWPISVINNLTKDIVNYIYTLVTTTFKQIYKKIYQSGTAGLITKDDNGS